MATEIDLAINLAVLEAELGWFETILTARLATFFGADAPLAAAAPPPPPPLDTGSALGQLLAQTGLDANERLVLILALVPSLRPQLLDLLLVSDKTLDRGYSEFGGTKSQSHPGFMPTGETAAFLIAGNELGARVAVHRWFGPDHVFHRRELVRLVGVPSGEPVLSGALVPGDGLFALLTTGVATKADFDRDVPARRITTLLDWSDLVLPPEVLADIELITGWMTHGPTIMADWGLDRILAPGYHCVFQGPPGTGKTLTATLLGKASGRDVLRVDLAVILSGDIGQTERDLARVFDRARCDDAILLFDEADCLFGVSANDGYAHQAAGSLLQRVEAFPGTAIVATNLTKTIDHAVARRFHALVRFPMPDAQQRLALWRGMLADAARVGPDVDFAQLADAHVLSGGAIANIVRFAALSALRDGRAMVAAADLARGVEQELRKEGPTS
jgi:ATPase family associated with various cellular activities (AAA)